MGAVVERAIPNGTQHYPKARVYFMEIITDENLLSLIKVSKIISKYVEWTYWNDNDEYTKLDNFLDDLGDIVGDMIFDILGISVKENWMFEALWDQNLTPKQTLKILKQVGNL